MSITHLFSSSCGLIQLSFFSSELGGRARFERGSKAVSNLESSDLLDIIGIGFGRRQLEAKRLWVFDVEIDDKCSWL